MLLSLLAAKMVNGVLLFLPPSLFAPDALTANDIVRPTGAFPRMHGGQEPRISSGLGEPEEINR